MMKDPKPADGAGGMKPEALKNAIRVAAEARYWGDSVPEEVGSAVVVLAAALAEAERKIEDLEDTAVLRAEANERLQTRAEAAEARALVGEAVRARMATELTDAEAKLADVERERNEMRADSLRLKGLALCFNRIGWDSAARVWRVDGPPGRRFDRFKDAIDAALEGGEGEG